eukprot:CAMPEP_0179140544 /NCGR_PEP_ID=MMETSP0796-20121207/67307_1 /TAXON_ID=73915 /ORGANISM="Pyrodinium bahamense, Strain pbaha01" /LENGTH=286 /DNA_ID=CAMNT_0020840103 /DNA_START=84 /DNA_END=941 /DNA_ORIENTATION=+
MARALPLACWLLLVMRLWACNPHNLHIQHPCANCPPSSASMFYKETYYVPDFAPLFVGSTVGWDASDPRYRWKGDPYGDWATPVYQDPITQATLYLSSAHVAIRDPKYIACLDVRTIINVGAKNWHQEDMMPYWRDIGVEGGPWRPYPNISIHVYDKYHSEKVPGSEELLDIRMQELQIWEYWGNIENWLDHHLSHGNSTMMHDHKGCRGAVAAAVAYIMRKTGMSYRPIYEEILAKRPCAKELKVREYPNTWHYKKMQEIGSGGEVEAMSVVVGARRRTPSQFQH